MERLIGEEVLVHPFKIGRIMFPTAANQGYASSLAHQDWSPIQGSFDTYACWIPIGDCPPEMGGLLFSTGSYYNGRLELKLANGLAVGESTLIHSRASGSRLISGSATS